MRDGRFVFRPVPLAVAAALLPAIPAALAQGGTADTQAQRTIEEIIVTAQKREQSLQDVPIVVTAISGELLQDTGVRDIKDLTILTPGLIVTSTSNETVTTARIRGVGTVGDNPGLESSVGVVIDGVYRPRNGVSFGDLGELQRVEVLKGPQGTLFGKNTSAGVINVITRQPEFDFGANLELGVGNYGAREAAASLTGPLKGETVAGRLFVAARERDGLYDVSTGAGPRTSDEDFDRSFYTVRGQLLFRPSDVLRARVIADYTDRDENCCAAVQIISGPTAPIVAALAPDSGLLNPPDPFRRRAFSNRPTDQGIEDMGLSAEVTLDLAAATLTSVTGWRDWETVNGQDSEFTTADILYRRPNGNFSNEFGQWSQELRLGGQADRLNWLVGAFYAREELDARAELLYGQVFEPYVGLVASGGTAPGLISQLTGLAPGAAFTPGTGQTDVHAQESDSWALFTNNTFAFTDRLEGTLGLRYTNEEKTLASRYTNVGGAPGCTALRNNVATIQQTLLAAGFPPQQIPTALQVLYGFGCATFADPVFNNFTANQAFDESEWSGTAKLAYRFTDDVMAYLSYARGYKAGGFNLDRERITASPASPLTQPDPDTAFPAEMVDSYEIGTKTSWLDNRLLLNATAFYQEYENFQLNTFTGISFIVASIPKLTSQGVDLDFLWFARGPELTLQGGLTYAETEYGNFTPGPGVSPLLPGNQMSFAPRWSGSLAATYQRPIGANLLWRTNLSAKTVSSYNTGSDLNPVKEQDAYTLVNARLGFGSSDDRWMIEAWAQNLLDEEYYQVVFDATLQPGTFNAFLGAPRTYGLTLRVRF